ncbi:MAG: DUF1559 domain-containing protein [Planctomycetales bacterium]|nr:DUF1559 domain-containing protein [Planctomycetales bacterium]
MSNAAQPRASRRHRRALTLVEGLIVAAILVVLVAVLLPYAPRGAREAARRNACLNNARQIGMALVAYSEEHGELPPAYTVDEAGNRLHSWRTLILPYMEYQSVYETIDLTKPWDDPANASARAEAIFPYACPSEPAETERETRERCHYVAVCGAGCAFDGATPQSLPTNRDELQRVVAVVETPFDRWVHWMSPEDISAEELLRLSADVQTRHPGGILHAICLDGHREHWPLDATREARRALLLIASDPADE